MKISLFQPGSRLKFTEQQGGRSEKPKQEKIQTRATRCLVWFFLFNFFQKKNFKIEKNKTKKIFENQVSNVNKQKSKKQNDGRLNCFKNRFLHIRLTLDALFSSRKKESPGNFLRCCCCCSNFISFLFSPHTRNGKRK